MYVAWGILTPGKVIIDGLQAVRNNLTRGIDINFGRVMLLNCGHYDYDVKYVDEAIT